MHSRKPVYGILHKSARIEAEGAFTGRRSMKRFPNILGVRIKMREVACPLMVVLGSPHGPGPMPLGDRRSLPPTTMRREDRVAIGVSAYGRMGNRP